MLNSDAWLPRSLPASHTPIVDREIHAVARINRLWDRLQSRFGERNFDFEDLRAILLSLGFGERVRGSHHIFTQAGVMERINFQREGGTAKP